MRYADLSILSKLSSFPPFCLISTEELSLKEEAAQKIRQFFQRKQVSVFQRFDAGTQLAREAFLKNLPQADLFSEKKVVELHFQTKIDKPTESFILETVNKLPDSIFLIIFCPLAKADLSHSSWVAFIEKKGLVFQLSAPTLEQFPKWIQQRLEEQGIMVSIPTAKIIAENHENNLTAAIQFLEKIMLRYKSGALDEEQILSMLEDHSHYTLSTLVEAWLARDKVKLLKILYQFREAAAEPLPIVNALIREHRLLIKLQFELMQNQTLPSLFQKYGVWKKRATFIESHLKEKFNYLISLKKLIFIEHIIKGVHSGEAWRELIACLVFI